MRHLSWFGMFMAVSGSAEAAAPPAEIALVGPTADKSHVRYKVKVNADKVTQVDFEIKYLDAAGKVTMQMPVAWQNVQGTAQPIEKGKTYEAEWFSPPGVAKYELKIVKVHFKDGPAWDAPK